MVDGAERQNTLDLIREEHDLWQWMQ